MFKFIKSLFKRKPTNTEVESKCPFLVHTDIGESIVIKEVKLEDVKPKTRKPKATQLKEVNLVEDPVVAKGVKPAAKKTKPKQVKSEPAKIVQLVQPLPTKKKGRPKKDKV
jgi:hypothetical protein